MLLQIGKYEIDIDTTKTRSYWEKLNPSSFSNQCRRNYIAYCNSLGPEEKAFFDEIGIQPIKAEMHGIRLDRDANYSISGIFPVVGRILREPKRKWIPAQELFEMLKNGTYKDPRLFIGRFALNVDDDNPIIRPHPDHMPGNAVYLSFGLEPFPWVLKERCKEKYNKTVRKWELHRKLSIAVRRAYHFAKVHHDVKTKLRRMLITMKVPSRLMSRRKTASYMNDWLKNMVPPDKLEEARKVCFPSRKYNAYLWHAFSYDLVKARTGLEAEKKYDDLKRKECVLLENFEQIGFCIGDGDKLSVSACNDYNDILVTAKDYSWCYVHTHEENCGPYFYQK